MNCVHCSEEGRSLDVNDSGAVQSVWKKKRGREISFALACVLLIGHIYYWECEWLNGVNTQQVHKISYRDASTRLTRPCTWTPSSGRVQGQGQYSEKKRSHFASGFGPQRMDPLHRPTNTANARVACPLLKKGHVNGMGNVYSYWPCRNDWERLFFKEFHPRDCPTAVFVRA